MFITKRVLFIFMATAVSVLCFLAPSVSAHFVLGPEAIVQANGTDIQVPGYSVPSFVHWDGDDLPDLIVGEGGLGIYEGKVRIYLNSGTPLQPVFTDFFYAQSNGADLTSPSSG